MQIQPKGFARRQLLAVIADGLEANAILEASGLRQQCSWCKPLQNLLRLNHAYVAQPHVIGHSLAKNQAAVIQPGKQIRQVHARRQDIGCEKTASIEELTVDSSLARTACNSQA